MIKLSHDMEGKCKLMAFASTSRVGTKSLMPKFRDCTKSVEKIKILIRLSQEGGGEL